MHGCCYFNETDEPEAIRVGHQHLCASSYHTAKGCGHSWGCYVESLCGDCNETPFFEAISPPESRTIEALFTSLPVAWSARGKADKAGGLRSMLYHRALGRDLATLAVAVIDNRRSMLLVMRAMLAAIGVGRIDTYENPAEAIDALARTTPDLLIAADIMQPLTGPALVRTMRRARSGPLALVPAIIMSAHGRPGLVADALRAGAHQVLVLPTAASTLARRLHWLLNDDRPFELRGEHYVVAGIEERLSLNLHRPAYTPAEASYPFLKSTPGGEELPAIDFAVKARAARN